jgi:hypothetical protein
MTESSRNDREERGRLIACIAIFYYYYIDMLIYYIDSLINNEVMIAMSRLNDLLNKLDNNFKCIDSIVDKDSPEKISLMRQTMPLLLDAIKEKIKQLNNDLTTYPFLFFMLPGVASLKDKKEKISALSQLQIRILGGPYTSRPPVNEYGTNALDGETLKLYQFARNLCPNVFTEADCNFLDNSHPLPRLFRLSL